MEQENQLIKDKNHLLTYWKERFSFNEQELQAFKTIDRENFIPFNLKNRAYEDNPLPLQRGKSISQPTTVMLMTSALELRPGDNVFEVGTGSGYQAALIATLIGKQGRLTTTEVIPELVMSARAQLQKARLTNITVYEEDGGKGMPDKAPFDKIIITAACKEFPKPLLEQLKVGGTIVAPIGEQDQQIMVKAIKKKDKGLDMEFLGPFVFTPMYGKYGFEV
jgi:protein-L-isoaspartate(D-aspartate) O-methyltransferase